MFYTENPDDQVHDQEDVITSSVSAPASPVLNSFRRPNLYSTPYGRSQSLASFFQLPTNHCPVERNPNSLGQPKNSFCQLLPKNTEIPQEEAMLVLRFSLSIFFLFLGITLLLQSPCISLSLAFVATAMNLIGGISLFDLLIDSVIPIDFVEKHARR